MAEKRGEYRQRRRIKVRFGEDGPHKFGFTDDLSENGFFIRSPQVERPKSRIYVELDIPGEEKVVLEAEVRWAKRVPLQMVQRGMKGGMGVRIDRFISGEEVFRRVLVEGASKVTA